MDEQEGRAQFIDLIANGLGPYQAGLTVGWSPHKTAQLLTDPEVMRALAASYRRIEDSYVRWLIPRPEE